MKKRVLVLGATGSVGTSVMDVIRAFPEDFELTGLTAHRNFEKFRELVEEFCPSFAGFGDLLPEKSFRPDQTELITGEDYLEQITRLPEFDMIVIAVSGMSGFLPTLEAIDNQGVEYLLSANKESIIVGGELIQRRLRDTGKTMIPLDSEHQAVFQLFRGMKKEWVRNLILTASGGPFRNKEIKRGFTIEEVLNHPTWDMGKFITVNSATMMNKGFEVIEAHHLFGFETDRIRVLIHPQSFVHGMLELLDGSILMLSSPNDMRYPVGLAMHYPEVPENRFQGLNFERQNLAFEEPDTDKFRLLKIAYQACEQGQTETCVLNASNETAVGAFLNGKIDFVDIPSVVEDSLSEICLEGMKLTETSSMKDAEEIILKIDWKTRKTVEEILKHYEL